MTGSSSSSHEESSSQKDSSQWHEGGAVSHVDFGVGLFALALTIGVISISQLTHRLHVPYTVLILCFGLSFGAIFKDFPHALGHSLEDSAHRWVYIDPEIILFTMLPILIFESAFSTCTHTFGKELGQVLTLAGPGVVLGTALTAAFCYYCLPYDWDIYVCLMFGAMLSATDPVAVVALLKELGISERLATLIEGESLLNDGTAVVVFDVFFHAAAHHRLLPAGAIAALGARLSLGGPLVGAGVGALGAWAVGFVITKPQAETAVTLVVCLGAFVLAEGTSLQVSGILAVVVAGLTFGQYGTGRISLSALHSVHAFWDALGYLANTTIFFVSGLIMAYKAFQYDQYIDARDWALVVALYLALHAIRALTLALAYPVLAYRGYGLGWRELAVLGWGGLRGAVGLALALIVEENEGLEEAVRARVLFHTAGVALLTLLVNGTTMGALLHALGMDRSNRAEAELFVRAAGVVERKLEAFAAALRRHPHLADADWTLVLRYIPVHTSRVYWHRIRHGLVELSREELRDVVGGGPGRRRPREESGGGGGGGAPLLPGWLRRLGGGEGSWARRAVDRLVPGWHYSALPPRLRSTWWRLHAGFQVPYGHDLAGILEDHALNTHSDAVDAVLHPLSARLRAAAGAVVMKQRGAAGAGAGGAAAPPTPLQSPNPAAAGAARPPPLQSPHHAGGRPGVVTSPAGRRRAPHEGGGSRGVESAVFPSPRIPHVKEMEERMEQAATAAAAAAAEGCAGQEGEGGADGGRGRCATLSSSRVSWAEGGNRSTTPPPGQSAASAAAAAAAQPPSSDAYHLEIVQTLRQEHHDYLAKIKQLEAKLSEAVRELGSKTQVAQNEVYRAVKINRRKRKQETVIFCKGKPDATPPHSEKRNNTGRRGAADLSPRASFEGKSNPKVAPETMDTLEPAPAMDTSGADSPAGAAAAGAAAAAAAGGTLLVLRPAEAEALAEARARFLAAVRSNYLTLHRQGYIGSGILRVLEQNLQQQMDDTSDPLDCWAHLERQFRVPEWLAKITRKTRSVPVLTSALHHLISAHISDCFDVTTTFLTALENVRTTELLPRGAAGDVLASEKAGQLAGARACLETVLPAFPEMVRSLKTRTAARVLLTQHAEICGALAAQGFVSEKENDLLIESNTKMKKFLASHPVAEKLPSRKSLASRVPFFRYLSSSDATSLAFDESVCHEEFHAAGVYLLGKGERSGPLNPSREGWYFVVRGCVCALDQEYNAEDGLDGKGAAFSSGLPTGARIIHSGSAFGMKSSVLGIPYRHTYISASFTHLIFFDKKELMARARARPALARGLWLGAAATALALDGAFARVAPRALYKVLHYSFYLDADIRDDGALRAALRPRRRSSLPQVPEEEVAALLSKQQTQQHLPFDEMKEGHITSRDGTTPGQGEEHRSPGTRRKTSPVRKIFVGPAQQNSTTPRVPNLRFPFSSRKNSIDGFKNTAGLLEDAEEEPKFEHDLEELVHGRSPEGNLLVDIADGDFVLLLQGEIYQQGVPVLGEGEEDEAGGGGGGGGGRHPRHLWGVAGEVALAPGSIAFVVPHEVLDWAHADARAHQAQQHAEGVDALHAHEVHRARAGMTQAWAQDYYRPDDHHVREAADRLKERDREERRAARAGPPPQLPTSPKKGGLARRNSAMLASATSIKSYKLHRGQGNEGDEGSSPVFIPHDGRREALCSSNVNTFKQEEGQGLQEGLTSV